MCLKALTPFVCRQAAHKTYSTPAGRAMPTPGPKGTPKVIQITRKIIQAICRTTAMGIMLEIRVPMAQSGMYFSWATLRIIQM